MQVYSPFSVLLRDCCSGTATAGLGTGAILETTIGLHSFASNVSLFVTLPLGVSVLVPSLIGVDE